MLHSGEDTGAECWIPEKRRKKLQEIRHPRDSGANRATKPQMCRKALRQKKGREFILRNAFKPCFFLKRAGERGAEPFQLLGLRLTLQKG